MDFNGGKLPKEAALSLRTIAVEQMPAYVPPLASAFVFLKLNEKFVRVKGPLDFFTPDSLKDLAPYRELRLAPESAEERKARQVARSVRKALGRVPAKNALAPASFELSDSVFKLIASLWQPGGAAVDPYSVLVFATELGAPIPSDLLLAARERSVRDYERALFGSAWSVFLGLHVGHADLAFLDRLRASAFEEISGLAPIRRTLASAEMSELLRVSSGALQSDLSAGPGSLVPADQLARISGRASRKLASRLKRVGAELGSATRGIERAADV